MTFTIGGVDVTAVHVGATAADAVYLGAEKVWPVGPATYLDGIKALSPVWYHDGLLDADGVPMTIGADEDDSHGAPSGTKAIRLHANGVKYTSKALDVHSDGPYSFCGWAKRDPPPTQTGDGQSEGLSHEAYTAYTVGGGGHVFETYLRSSSNTSVRTGMRSVMVGETSIPNSQVAWSDWVFYWLTWHKPAGHSGVYFPSQGWARWESLSGNSYSRTQMTVTLPKLVGTTSMLVSGGALFDKVLTVADRDRLVGVSGL